MTPESPTPQDPVIALAQTAVARLCHDLSGSLGAVMNGLDLAAGNADMAAEALLLAHEAAREGAARLRLARMIWAGEQPLPPDELMALAEGLPNRVRTQLDIAALAPTVLASRPAQLLMAVLTMAAEALHGAGSIVVSGDAANAIEVAIAGRRAAWPAELPALLTGAATWSEGLEPRALASHLAVLLAARCGATLSLLPPAATAAAAPTLRLHLAP